MDHTLKEHCRSSVVVGRTISEHRCAVDVLIALERNPGGVQCRCVCVLSNDQEEERGPGGAARPEG